ncbi:hypothetical protein SDC9_13045 [bioreactor metagenome]|uniref:Uncharacterized protein n=1 Tax=bioreactor metagenome TaxID=1076179 RepID=A0A644TKB3_9ZZZZ
MRQGASVEQTAELLQRARPRPGLSVGLRDRLRNQVLRARVEHRGMDLIADRDRDVHRQPAIDRQAEFRQRHAKRYLEILALDVVHPRHDRDEAAVAVIGDHHLEMAQVLEHRLGDVGQDAAELGRAAHRIEAFHPADLEAHRRHHEAAQPAQPVQVVLHRQRVDDARHIVKRDRVGQLEGHGLALLQAVDLGAQRLRRLHRIGGALLLGIEHLRHPQPRAEFLHFDRLGDVIGGAGGKGRVDEGLLGDRGQHQDRRAPVQRIGADMADEFDPVHPRHLDVEQEGAEQITATADLLQRFLAAHRILHIGITERGQDPFHQPQDDRVVVDHKQCHRFVSASAGREHGHGLHTLGDRLPCCKQP